ncbi:MAG: hypothetical protein AAF288_14025 [Planctomycetota bacterium]
MAGKKAVSSKSKGKGRGKVDPARPAWDVDKAWRTARVLAAAGCVLGGVAAWGVGRVTLADAARASAEARPMGVVVQIEDRPAWTGGADHPAMVEARRLVADAAGADPLSTGTLTSAAEALGASPWVRNVVQVRRGGDGVIRVWAEFRDPAAVVGSAAGYHLVDAYGVKLPLVYRADQLEPLGLPTIAGVIDPPPRSGQTWAGGVEEGLSLVRLIAGEPWAPRLRWVDVGQRDALGRMNLWLRVGDATVHWGLAPSSPDVPVIEPGGQEKLGALRELADRGFVEDRRAPAYSVSSGKLWRYRPSGLAGG